MKESFLLPNKLNKTSQKLSYSTDYSRTLRIVKSFHLEIKIDLVDVIHIVDYFFKNTDKLQTLISFCRPLWKLTWSLTLNINLIIYRVSTHPDFPRFISIISLSLHWQLTVLVLLTSRYQHLMGMKFFISMSTSWRKLSRIEAEKRERI